MGQLGVQDNQDRNTPTRVQFPITNKYSVESISCGNSHSLALILDSSNNLNSLYTCGAPIANGFKRTTNISYIIQALSGNPSTI